VKPKMIWISAGLEVIWCRYSIEFPSSGFAAGVLGKGSNARSTTPSQICDAYPCYRERPRGVQNTSSDFTNDSISLWCWGIPKTGML
jgi:hypothetical protein